MNASKQKLSNVELLYRTQKHRYGFAEDETICSMCGHSRSCHPTDPGGLLSMCVVISVKLKTQCMCKEFKPNYHLGDNTSK